MKEEIIGDARLILGDVLKVLRQLPEESINCVITSPPYWGLRDYGVPGQIGLEHRPELYILKLKIIFNQIRRVLRTDGTCWINLGDSYAGGGNGARDETRWPKQSRNANGYKSIHVKKGSGCKPKDLVGIPWAVAFALRAAGWWLRQDIIWSKPNTMPESVRDRCTKSHEYIFLLTKNARYYFNQNAIMEKASENTHARVSQNIAAQIGSFRANGGAKTNGPMKTVFRGSSAKVGKRSDGVKANESFLESVVLMPDKRNKRSVWEIAPTPFKEAHFATFPEKLVEPCVLAGCPPDGVVMDPFMGSGTTGIVAIRLGRKFVGIELKPEYLEMAKRRIKKGWAHQPRLFPAAEIEPKPQELFPACPQEENPL